MPTLDMKKEFKELYSAKRHQVKEVDVPVLNYLTVNGEGNPNNSSLYINCVQALYGLAYAIKFDFKAQNRNFVVMPLQGLWYMKNMKDWSMEHKEKWQWTLMIVMPDVVSDKIIERAKGNLSKKKALEKLSDIRFEKIEEGRAVQIMHIGPYDQERDNIKALHFYAKKHGYTLQGKHHEIYLSDPRKISPEKLKTIIRQPVG